MFIKKNPLVLAAISSAVILSGCGPVKKPGETAVEIEKSVFYLPSHQAKSYSGLHDLYQSFIYPKLNYKNEASPDLNRGLDSSKSERINYHAVLDAARKVCTSGYSERKAGASMIMRCEKPELQVMKTTRRISPRGLRLITVSTDVTGNEALAKIITAPEKSNKPDREAYAQCVQNAGNYSNGFQGTALINYCHNRYIKR